jgi:ribonuclease P protein component
MLQPNNRLRRTADLKRVRQAGKALRHPLLVFIWLATDQPVNRFAIVASRRIGNAVTRNRVKRLIRESVRLSLPNVRSGCDCVFIAREPIIRATYREIETAVYQLLYRANLVEQIV